MILGERLRVALRLGCRSWALLTAAARRQTLALVALTALQALLPLGMLWASRGVVNAAAQAFGLAAAGGESGPPLPAWVGVAVALIVAQQLLGPLIQAVQESTGDLLTAHIGGEVIAATTRWRGLARFEDPVFADHLAVVQANAANGPVQFLSYTARLMLAVFTIVVMAVTLGRLHPLAAILPVAAAIPAALQQNHFGQMMANTQMTQSANGRRLGSYFRATLDAEAAKDVRLFALGEFFLGQHTALFDRMLAELWTLRRGLLGQMLPAQALAGAGAAAVYLYAIHRLLNGAVSLGDLVLFGGVLLQLEAALTSAGSDAGFIAAYFGWLPSLFKVLDAEPDLPTQARPLPAPRPIRGGIALEHVSFRYPDAPADTLHDISFAIRPGERLALVGRNGAGKTTLVKLLCRLYDPTAGRILLDGVDLREYDLDDLRRQIGVVFQDFVTYQLTAQENIGLGDIARLGSLDHVRAAARKGGAAAITDQLPHGYATQLGSDFGGINLSGGQWQKIALSRAFMRQAQLLILDEPTAALDVQAEYEVYQGFTELTAGAMTVLISHRFSTVRMADHIVYLEDGRLGEEGTHLSLLTRAGGYARLYRLQADLYADEGTPE